MFGDKLIVRCNLNDNDYAILKFEDNGNVFIMVNNVLVDGNTLVCDLEIKKENFEDIIKKFQGVN